MTPPELTKFQILIKYFGDNFSLELLTAQRPPVNWFEKRAKFYFGEIIEFNSAIEKVEKYPLYFKLFYPASNEITEEEAMEHHWHSYMQDIYIVEQRGVTLLGTLKSDLPRYNLRNPEMAIMLIDHLKTNLMRGLESATRFRGGHTHRKTVHHPELSRVRALKTIKQFHSELTSELSANIDGRISESLDKSKKEYIEMSEKNTVAMREFRDFFSPRFGHLFASLHGHDHSMFKMN